MQESVSFGAIETEKQQAINRLVAERLLDNLPEDRAAADPDPDPELKQRTRDRSIGAMNLM